MTKCIFKQLDKIKSNIAKLTEKTDTGLTRGEELELLNLYKQKENLLTQMWKGENL